MLAADNRDLHLILGVHDIDLGYIYPAVKLHGLAVSLRRVSAAVICRVALDDGSADLINYALHKLRTQEVLVSRLAAVKLHGDVARKLCAESVKSPNDILRVYVFNKIYFRFFHCFYLLYINIVQHYIALFCFIQEFLFHFGLFCNKMFKRRLLAGGAIRCCASNKRFCGIPTSDNGNYRFCTRVLN